MIDAANQNGVHLMEAFAYLHTPYIAALKSELNRGAIGDLVYLESAFITGIRKPEDIRMRKECYGGALYDLGCYTTSMITWMLGEEPEKVQAFADFSQEGIDLFTSALLTFPGGKRAALECGMVLDLNEGKRIDRLEIHGTKGYIRSTTEFNQAGELSYTLFSNGKEEVKSVSVGQNYTLEVEQLGRCILNGETPYVNEAFSLRLSRTMDRVLQAMGY